MSPSLCPKRSGSPHRGRTFPQVDSVPVASLMSAGALKVGVAPWREAALLGPAPVRGFKGEG